LAWSIIIIKLERLSLTRAKSERSHLTDEREFYQLLNYKDDVDLNEKLNQWENFYNFERPHFAHSGKTPYEILKNKLTD
jgi:transposase InsO family protein